MLFPRDDADHPLARSFRHFLQDPEFPCVGAKSALSRDQIKIVVARDITSGWDDLRIYPALLAFVSWYKRAPGLFRSFAVIFETPTILSEADFERHLWARVQSFSDKDTWLGLPYDERVQAHPDDPHFSLSFGGEAFFVVGLHPNASRKARRFEAPALVFNLHDQFEQLRADGRYHKTPGPDRRAGSPVFGFGQSDAGDPWGGVRGTPVQRPRRRRRLGLPLSSPERGFACGMKFLRAPGWRSPWTEVRSSPSSTRTANRSPTSWPSTGRTPTR